MSTSICSRTDSERGFSLLEVLISLMITLIVMGAVFTLLQRGHNSFRLEPEVADMNANARAGLSRITQDLTIAGYNTPAPTAIMWLNGGGAFGATGTPDERTIVYADPEIPWAYALPCSKQGGGGGGGKGKGGGGACKTIGRSATLFLVSDSLSPSPADPTKAYTDGMVLTALTMPNPDPASACGAVTPAVIPFELTGKPACSPVGEESKTYGKNCSSVRLNRNPGSGSAGINLPKGFNNDVNPDCAVIGVFHIVQYRINPLPPTANPMLERRDLADPDPVTRGLWVPVAANIENLQVQYSQGFGQLFEDEPSLLINYDNPDTYVTQVLVSVFGRSASTNLQGATAGVFAAEDTYLRRAFSTNVSLRNQLASAQEKCVELAEDDNKPNCPTIYN